MSLSSFFARWWNPSFSKESVRIRQDQRTLVFEIERIRRELDRRLESLSTRIAHDAEPQACEEDLMDVKRAQRTLRLLMYRYQALEKTRTELERELVEWESRRRSVDDEDDPRVRAEIIRSELAIRALEAQPIVSFQKTKNLEPSFVSKRQSWDAPAVSVLRLIDTPQLLRAIDEATREAARWHAVPIETHDQDALMQIHHVRELHSMLKQEDRRQGVQRDRLELAIRLF